jgi:hypothetical protein
VCTSVCPLSSTKGAVPLKRKRAEGEAPAGKPVKKSSSSKSSKSESKSRSATTPKKPNKEVKTGPKKRKKEEDVEGMLKTLTLELTGNFHSACLL